MKGSLRITWTFLGQDPTVSRNSLEVWLLSHQEDHIAVLLAVDQRRRAEREQRELLIFYFDLATLQLEDQFNSIQFITNP
jgi:hypothetical protein